MSRFGGSRFGVSRGSLPFSDRVQFPADKKLLARRADIGLQDRRVKQVSEKDWV